jgi:GxxExxY protein
MEVHNYLGSGFLESVYKEALEIEFIKANIPFEREKRYEVIYKGEPLSQVFIADFVLYDEIILEVKAVSELRKEFLAQTMNYLKVSENRLGILVNFGEPKLNYKRVLV